MIAAATDTVLILEPSSGAGDLDREPSSGAGDRDHAIMRNCLRHAGLRGVEHAPGSPVGLDAGAALLIHGGLAVRGYLRVGPSPAELVEPAVREIIREFFHAGKPIAAPCMGLAVVLEALADLLPGSLILHGAPTSSRAVAVYPALRLVTTHRPLIGRAPADVARALALVAHELRRLMSS